MQGVRLFSRMQACLSSSDYPTILQDFLLRGRKDMEPRSPALNNDLLVIILLYANRIEFSSIVDHFFRNSG